MPVDAVYGEPLEGVDVTVVPVELAPLFAAAHERVTRQPAGAHMGGGTVIGAARDRIQRGVSVDEAVMALSDADAPVVLAGPGVARDGAVDGLRALAEGGNLGVLNTWGAKGVFDWRSPHHLATAGLQALDFQLGGLAEADLIVATGVDEAEALGGWRLAPVVEVAPQSLAAVSELWGRRPGGGIAAPALRTELARVTQDGWAVDVGPLPPTRVTLQYGEVLGAGGVVAAEPGTAGYWVARTFPTARLGQAIVPSETDRPGLAAACAVVARLVDPARLVLLVLDGTTSASRSGRGPGDGQPAASARAHDGDGDGSNRVGSGGPAASARARDGDGDGSNRVGSTPSADRRGGHGDRSIGLAGTARTGGRPVPATGVESAVTAVLDAAAALGVRLAIEVWQPGGDVLGASEHRARLQELLVKGGTATLSTDERQLDAMVEVAGPVVAWGGLPGRQAGPKEAS